MKLKVVAWQSDGKCDTLYVEDGNGDYPVIRPYAQGKRKFFCLICQSETCRHVHVVQTA